MPRARTVRLRGQVERFSEAGPLLPAPGDYVFVVRGVTRAIVMRCPDQCGDLLTINLDDRAGPAWRSYRRSNRLTVYPSVWRKDGCRSHFILWDDRLLWCDWHDQPQWKDAELRRAVLKALPAPHENFRHYEAIAADINAIPWEVLWCCQTLVQSGQASAEGKGTMYRARNTSEPGSGLLI